MPNETWPDHGPTYRDWVDYVIRNSSHATQVLTPGGWSEWDAGRYARQQYEEMSARLATATELVRDMQAMLEQLPTGIDTEADESDTSPEDMVAHIGGLMWKRLAAFLEGCRSDNPEVKA